MRLILLVLITLISASQVARSQQLPFTSSLHFAYQKVGGPKMAFVSCRQTEGDCRHDLERGAYVLASGDGERTPVTQVAAYFGADQPGGWQATTFLQASFKVFSPKASPQSQGAAIRQIVEQAASTKRGEITLSGVKYVLRASDGNDIRVYITLP